MACVTIEHSSETRPSGILQRLAGIWRRLGWRLARPDQLDLEGMPDRVKRDLGFMDGRDPFYEAEPWR